MEKAQRLQQTTSTSFYDPASRKTSTQFPMFNPMKSSFPDLILSIENMNDRTYIIQMEQEISQIQKTLRKCQQNIAKISQVEELKSLIQKMQQELVQARQKYLLQNSEVKEQIENMLNSLQKLVQSLKKDWERLRNKCQAQLSQEIQQIKTQKTTNQVFLTSLLKSTAPVLKEEINQFTQQLKLSKKNRNARTSKLFTHLQFVRSNLINMVAEQQAKRNEYDEIIYGLLDKTCQNATNALRRRVY